MFYQTKLVSRLVSLSVISSAIAYERKLFSQSVDSKSKYSLPAITDNLSNTSNCSQASRRFTMYRFNSIFATVECEESTNVTDTSQPVVIDVEEIDEEDWDAKARNCGFCKFFLESPCAEEFKNWNRCITKAKKTGEDFAVTCRDVSNILFGCTRLNDDYFKVLNNAQGNNSEDSNENPEEDDSDDSDDEEEVSSDDLTEDSSFDEARDERDK